MSAVLRSDVGHVARHTHRMTDVMEFPSSHPEYVDRQLPLTCKPGVFAAEMYPARELSAGGIHLPSNGFGWGTEGAAAERTRPDCVIVQSVGPRPADDYHPQKMWRPHWEGEREILRQSDQVRSSACNLARSLEPGDRVMVRPWSGARYEELFGVKGLAFYGQTDLWEEDAVLVRNLDGGVWSWRPLTNWVVVKLDKTTDSTLLVSSVPILDVKGTVLDAGPLASVRPGDRVICADDMAIQSDDDRKWLTTKWGNWGEDVWLVREVCQDGKRRVLGRLG